MQITNWDETTMMSCVFEVAPSPTPSDSATTMSALQMSDSWDSPEYPVWHRSYLPSASTCTVSCPYRWRHHPMPAADDWASGLWTASWRRWLPWVADVLTGINQIKSINQSINQPIDRIQLTFKCYKSRFNQLECSHGGAGLVDAGANYQSWISDR